MTGPFGTIAPAYWAKNLPVIPLRPFDLAKPDGTRDPRAGKAPVMGEWSAFCLRMPTAEDKAVWQQNYSAVHNVGLPCGPMSGVVAIDIDHRDPKVVAAVETALPVSPWHRIGEKGKVIAFRWHGEKTNKSMIDADTGKAAVEILSSGTQFVLPPSIHPITKQPYLANCELLDVILTLPSLPVGYEDIIRDALLVAGVKLTDKKTGGVGRITDFISAGGRDTMMTSRAGLFSMDILRGKMTLKEALDRIEDWVTGFTQQVYGDSLDPNRAKAKIVEFLLRDVTSAKKSKLPPGWDAGLTPDHKKTLGLDRLGEADVILSITKLIEMNQSRMIAIDPSTPDYKARLISTAEEVAFATSRNNEISSIEMQHLAEEVDRATGGMIKAAAFRRRVSELRDAETIGDNHVEIARAVLVDLQSTEKCAATPASSGSGVARTGWR